VFGDRFERCRGLLHFLRQRRLFSEVRQTCREIVETFEEKDPGGLAVREQAYVLRDTEGRTGGHSGIVRAGRHPRERLAERAQPRCHHSERTAGEKAQLLFGFAAVRKEAYEHHQHQFVDAIEDFGELAR
jgi:hypothetical protein